MVLACAGLVGIPYHLDLIALLTAQLALTALAMTALGAVVAVTIRRLQTFNTVLSLMMTPLIFLSGLMFPISAMPGWLSALSLFNPLTYAVDALRRTITGRLLDHTPSALFEPVSWGSWTSPALAEIAVVIVFTAGTLGYASRRFAQIG